MTDLRRFTRMLKTQLSLVVSFTIAVFFGCQKSDLSSPYTASLPSDIRGSVADWQFGDSMAISAIATVIGPGTPFVLAKGSVRSDGTFFLSLPEPSPSTIQKVNSPYDTLSDTSTSILLLSGLLVSNADESACYWVINQQRGGQENSLPALVEVDYFYADRPVTWRRTLASGSIDTTVVVFDLQLNQGWNRVIVRTEHLWPHYIVSTFRVEDISVPTWYIALELSRRIAL